MANRRGGSRGGDAERLRKLDEYYRQVADTLIAQIEEGTARWTQAWSPGEKALPANVSTGKAYRGGNSVWLASTADRRGYGDHRWGTYRQVQELGGHVRRGQKGSAILYWQFEAKRVARDKAGKPVLDEKGKPVYETQALQSPRVYQYRVFNAEQCDGLPRRDGRNAAAAWEGHREAERILKGSGAVIEHAGKNRAYYDLRRDKLVLPYKEQFPDGPKYYQTALHELGHWTGHPSRLNRATLMKGIEDGFASPSYAREELRAEISSMITGDRLDIGHDPSRHAAYVGSWVQALREDPREIYRAAKDGQDISDYTIELARDRGGERDPGGAGGGTVAEREPARPAGPAPEASGVETRSPAEAEPGEQQRLFQRERERAGPSR